jgi:[ribosomal protein S5]-alanine N-acetyltransferase
MGYLLTSAHLGFRPWTEHDLPLALNLWGDPAVTRYLGGPFDGTAVQARLATEIVQFQQTGLQYWPVFCRETHAHIGCAGLRPYPAAPRTFEFGIHLLPGFWGKGLAAEAAQLVLSHAFHTLGAQAVFAGHHPQNHASRRLLAKLGFFHTHDQFYPPTRQMHPSYLLPAPSAARDVKPQTPVQTQQTR